MSLADTRHETCLEDEGSAEEEERWLCSHLGSLERGCEFWCNSVCSLMQCPEAGVLFTNIHSPPLPLAVTPCGGLHCVLQKTMFKS